MTEYAFGRALDPEVLHADAIRFAEGCWLQSPSLRTMIDQADRVLTGRLGPGADAEALAWLFEFDEAAWNVPTPLEAWRDPFAYGTMGRWRLVAPRRAHGPMAYGTAVVSEFHLTY